MPTFCEVVDISRPKDTIKTDVELDEMNSVLVVNNRLYSRDVDASDKVSAIVEAIGESVIEPKTRIQLRETETVKDVTARYLRSCYRTGVIPSKTGLARACGCSRNALDQYCKKNPEHPTSQFLQLAFDAFSEMLSMSSLAGGNHPIVGIFLLKAIYNYRDNTPQELQDNTGPLGSCETNEALIERYMSIEDE